MSDSQFLPSECALTKVLLDKPHLTILFQDEYIVAVNKPAGLFVHRSFMDKDEIYFAVQLVRDQIGQYVYPVHRLDRPTSGVLLFALTKEVASLLSEAFANKSELATKQVTENSLAMKKTYFALVRGHIDLHGKSGANPESGLIDYPLKEKLDKIGDKFVSENKAPQAAKTFAYPVAKASLAISLGKYDSVRYSLVKLLPVTGRRHQIRRHLAHLRYPIIGDINYGDNKQNPFFHQQFGFKRLMLMAKSLEFNHPITNELVAITAPFDHQWQSVFKALGWSSEAL